MQKGICAVIEEFIRVEEVHCHYILPKPMGGTDEFGTLVIVHEWIHILIHAKDKRTIERYLRVLKLNEKQLKKLNKLRKMCNLLKGRSWNSV